MNEWNIAHPFRRSAYLWLKYAQFSQLVIKYTDIISAEGKKPHLIKYPW